MEKIQLRLKLILIISVFFLFHYSVYAEDLPDIGSFQTANALPTGKMELSSEYYNGFVYAIGGGLNSGTAQTYYAPVNSNGSVGSWVTSPHGLPVCRHRHSSAVVNGYMYVMGGNCGGSAQSTVYFTEINSDGSIDAWNTTTFLPVGRRRHSTVVANGYIYVIGGSNPGWSTVYYAKPNSDGTITSWSLSPNALPDNRFRQSSIVYNNYIYVIGGDNASTVKKDTVFYAQLNSDGSTGVWQSTTSLPAATQVHTSITANGYVYVVGGETSSGYEDSVYFAKINSDGTIGTWHESSRTLPAIKGYHSTAMGGNYFYAIGGYAGSSELDTVYYANTDGIAPSISLTDSNSGIATDTSGTVSSVDYQIDGTSGTWSSCTATDGSFNSSTEAFTCTIANDLSEGEHTIYVRSGDNVGNSTSSGSYASDVFTTDTTSPTAFSIISPSGYTNKATKPTISFKKSTDTTSGMANYEVYLDQGKNRSFSYTGIPSNGNSKANNVWKDDNQVRIEFSNEEDNSSDTTNDEIHVYFKPLDSRELSQGKHTVKIIAKDSSGNSREETTSFFIDRESPGIRNIGIANVSGNVQNNQVYNLLNTQRAPKFTGIIYDTYNGSTVTNNDTSKDTFDSVSSGPKALTLTIDKLKDGHTPEKADDNSFKQYSSQSLIISDIKSKEKIETYAAFTIELSQALSDGYYKAQMKAEDKAGNTVDALTIYLSVNYKSSVVSNTTNAFTNIISGDKSLETNIINTEKIKDERITDSSGKNSQKTTAVTVSVLDQKKNPVKGAKVTLYSEPKVNYTDANGKATFSNIMLGKHTLAIEYDGYTGTQPVDLTEKGIREHKITVEIERKTKPSYFYFIGGGIILLIAVVIVYRKTR